MKSSYPRPHQDRTPLPQRADRPGNDARELVDQGLLEQGTLLLTKSFKELVQRRVVADSDFASALLREDIDTMLSGDVDTGKAILDGNDDAPPRTGQGAR